MNKKLSIVLALCITMLFIFNSTSMAEASYDDEIVFNNIPWDISILEANEIMVSLGFKNYEPRSGDLRIWPYYWWTDTGVHTVKETGFNLGGSYSYSENVPHIGGHPVDWVYLMAYYDFDEKGVNKDPALSHYCSAVIVFDVEYELADSVYSDLESKLTKLYGEPTLLSNGNTIASEWHGANSTAVDLEEVIYEKAKVVGLLYGFTNIEDKLLEVREAVIKSKPEVDGNDFGGL